MDIKMCVRGKTSRKWLTVAIWMSWSVMDDFHGWLSWMTFMDDCHGWLSSLFILLSSFGIVWYRGGLRFDIGGSDWLLEIDHWPFNWCWKVIGGGWLVVYLDYNVSSGPFLSYEIEIGDGPGPKLDTFWCLTHKDHSQFSSMCLLCVYICLNPSNTFECPFVPHLSSFPKANLYLGWPL